MTDFSFESSAGNLSIRLGEDWVKEEPAVVIDADNGISGEGGQVYMPFPEARRMAYWILEHAIPERTVFAESTFGPENDEARCKTCLQSKRVINDTRACDSCIVMGLLDSGVKRKGESHD